MSQPNGIPALPAAHRCKPGGIALPENLLAPYHCPLCGDTGFIEIDRFNVRLCRCHSIRTALGDLRRLGLLHSAQQMRLDTFRAEAPWQQKLLGCVREYLAQENPTWLFIGGQSGCGKTHLCTAAAVSLLFRGWNVCYMRWMNDSARLKSLALDAQRASMLDHFIDAPLLYIDDLFKSQPTEADRHIAFEILGARYSDPGKITIISSERTIEEITHIDEAVGGRIFERCTAAYQLNVSRNPERNYRFRPTEMI